MGLDTRMDSAAAIDTLDLEYEGHGKAGTQDITLSMQYMMNELNESVRWMSILLLFTPLWPWYV